MLLITVLHRNMKITEITEWFMWCDEFGVPIMAERTALKIAVAVAESSTEG